MWIERIINVLQSKDIGLSFFLRDFNGKTPLDLAKEKDILDNVYGAESSLFRLDIGEAMLKREVERQQYYRAASDVFFYRHIPLEVIKMTDINFGRAAEAAHAIRLKR